MFPENKSKDEEKESLVPVDLRAPFSDAEGGLRVQTTFDSSQQTISRQRTTIRILSTILTLIILSITPVIYKSIFPSINVRHKPLVESFPLVPAHFPIDKNWWTASGQDPYHTAWWPNEDSGFAHNGTTAKLAPGEKHWHPTQDSEENIWAGYGNPYIMLHKDDPLWLPHGTKLKQTGPEDAWMADYNGFITVYGHGVHCLGTIRHHLSQATHDPDNLDPVELEHANGHCIEILRRQLECNPNLYMTGLIDTKFWNGETQNNPNMCRAGVKEWLREREIPRHVLWELTPDTREGTVFSDLSADIRDFDRHVNGN